jgi:hypothetical protein
MNKWGLSKSGAHSFNHANHSFKGELTIYLSYFEF